MRPELVIPTPEQAQEISVVTLEPGDFGLEVASVLPALRFPGLFVRSRPHAGVTPEESILTNADRLHYQSRLSMYFVYVVNVGNVGNGYAGEESEHFGAVSDLFFLGPSVNPVRATYTMFTTVTGNRPSRLPTAPPRRHYEIP